MEEKKIKAISSKIGLKLIIPYMIISFLTLMLIAGLVYYNFKEQIDSIYDVQEEISIKASSDINYYIANIIHELNIFSEEIGKTNAFEKEMDAKSLKNLINNNPSIYSLSIADIEGNEINKIIRYDIEASSKLKNIYSQEKFKRAVEEDFYISSVYISEFQIPFISISIPIKDENNKKIGVLAAELDLSPMWGTVSKIKVKKTGYVYVVDHEGNLIAYKNINLVKENLNLKHIQGVKNFIGNTRKPETYVSFNDKKVIGNWNAVDAANWGVIVELPSKEIFKELSPLLLIAIISIILFVLFISIILITIFERLLVPINYLKKRVIEVKNGNLNCSIKIDSGDELGELAQTFDEMRLGLKDRNELLNNIINAFKGKAGGIAYILLRKNIKDFSDKNPRILDMLPGYLAESIRKEKRVKDKRETNEVNSK